jgi:hypothetical protein
MSTSLFRKNTLALQMAQASIERHFNRRAFLLDQLNFTERHPTSRCHYIYVTGVIHSDQRQRFEVLAHFEHIEGLGREWYPFRTDLSFDGRRPVHSSPEWIDFCRFADSRHDRFILSQQCMEYRMPSAGDAVYLCVSPDRATVIRGKAKIVACGESGEFVTVKEINGSAPFIGYKWEDLVFHQAEWQRQFGNTLAVFSS